MAEQSNVDPQAYFSDLAQKNNWKLNMHGSESAFRNLVTVGAFARNNFIYPEYVVLNLITPPGFYMHRTKYNSYQIQLTISGQGILNYQNRQYILREGDCFFIDCREDHYFSTAGDEPWIHHGLQINGHQMSSIYNYFSQRDSVKVSFGLESRIGKYFQDIARISTTLFSSTGFLMNKLLTGLITDIILVDQMLPSDILPTKLQSVCDYINSNFSTIKNIDEIAKACYISKFYMCHEFKRHMGKSVVDFMTLKRINAAKSILTTSSVTIAEVASHVGFNSSNYFYIIFKKIVGLTPTEYRDQWSGHYHY